MGYGNDINVYVDDQAGQVGAQPSPAPWWHSPDVDIVGHSGIANPGPNDVRIRVHCHDEPILEGRILAEVYVGDPSFVLSPTTGTVRIDPSDLIFRTSNTPGPEPVADVAGGTRTFSWTPSTDAAAPNGIGHRCLIVRAFPEAVPPPTDPFNVPNEQHEAQRNIEVLSTQMDMGSMGEGGAGVPKDPRRRDEETGMWWERFRTMAAVEEGEHFVVWAFDPRPSRAMIGGLKGVLPAGKRFGGFSGKPPAKVTLEARHSKGEEIPPGELFGDKQFVESSGIGTGVFREDRLVGALRLTLAPQDLAEIIMRFDHSNLKGGTGVVLHGAQFRADGTPEGGMTVVALAPVSKGFPSRLGGG